MAQLPEPNRMVPAVPAPLSSVDSLMSAVQALKQGLESLGGSRGDAMDRAVTFWDMINLGLVSERTLRSFRGQVGAPSGGVTLAGDVTSSTARPSMMAVTVVGLQNRPLSAVAPALDEVLVWGGAAWEPGAGAAPTVTLSGDVTGTGTSDIPTTLAAVNGSTGTFQGLTLDAKGRVIAAVNQSYLTGNQTVTLSGDVTGSGTTAITTTLPNVNVNVGTFQGLTVNAKGLVTAATAQGYISGNQAITLSGAVSGTGTTAIATTLATVPIASGGTAVTAYTQGDILYASATNVLSRLAKDATASRYLANTGASNAPAWAQVALGTGVSGTLPVANGGTNVTTYTQGDIIYASATDVLSRLPKDATASRYLANTGASNSPAWAQVSLTTGVTGTLPLTSGGTSSTSAAAALTALGALPLVGGTMTGGLTISPASGWAVTILNKPTATDGNQIIGQRAGVARWDIQLGGSGAESGSNAGSDFAIGRWSDAGAYLGTALSITRAAGNATLAGALGISHGGGIPVVLNTPVATDCHLEFHNGTTGDWKIGAMGYSSAGQFFIYDVQRSRTSIAIDTANACFNSSGSWTALSDPSLKEEIQPYSRGLEAIASLNCVSYRYKSGTPFATGDEPSRVFHGLLANEVLPHIPEVCGETEITVKGEETTVATLNPGDLIFSLINAVKELAARIEALEARSPLGPETVPGVAL